MGRRSATEAGLSGLSKTDLNFQYSMCLFLLQYLQHQMFALNTSVTMYVRMQDLLLARQLKSNQDSVIKKTEKSTPVGVFGRPRIDSGVPSQCNTGVQKYARLQDSIGDTQLTCRLA